MKFPLIQGLLLSLACSLGAEPVKPLVVTDLENTAHTLFADKQTKAAVFVFIAKDCPIANFYQPELRRLTREFSPQGVEVFQVHPDPDVTLEEARKHAREFSLLNEVILDPKQDLVRRFGATVTPEAVVLRPDLTIAYRGRIDDSYSTYGKRRPEPTTRDLQEALTAVLAGRNPATPRTKAVGCLIFLEPR